MRPFRFGMVQTGATDARAWRERVRRLEGEGFATVVVADHYANDMAATPLITAAADATTTLRVGSYVYDNDFRHPALLAKEAATIDVLSDGRLELGVGAGWYREEYDWIGMPFDPGSVRVDRLEESLDVVTALLAGETVTHHGTHYDIDGLEGLPVAIQQPVPLLIGGGGPRMLRLAARRAAIVALVPRSRPEGGLDPEEFGTEPFERRIAGLDAALRDVGRSGDGPERGMLVFEMASSVDAYDADDAWIDRERVAASPYALVGDVGAMVDAVVERRERWGVTYFVCFDRNLDLFEPVVRRLAGT